MKTPHEKKQKWAFVGEGADYFLHPYLVRNARMRGGAESTVSYDRMALKDSMICLVVIKTIIQHTLMIQEIVLTVMKKKMMIRNQPTNPSGNLLKKVFIQAVTLQLIQQGKTPEEIEAYLRIMDF